MTGQAMGTKSATPVVEGYHVLEPLGAGATSTVWRARSTSGGAEVAIKVVQPERYHIGALMELAARESAILARVRHDHVVGLHEVLPLADGSVALVLDLADGGQPLRPRGSPWAPRRGRGLDDLHPARLGARCPARCRRDSW
ncbi:MAG: protein kinase [Actinomycetales bacterium]|nr:protein kinase [Actinomycetales bacterium]